MENLFTSESHLIRAGQLISGSAKSAQTLRVLHGQVWVTMAGTNDDFWLQKGDTLNLPPDRLVVVEADKHASIVETRANPLLETKPSPWERLWKNLQQAAAAA